MKNLRFGIFGFKVRKCGFLCRKLIIFKFFVSKISLSAYFQLLLRTWRVCRRRGTIANFIEFGRIAAVQRQTSRRFSGRLVFLF
ncbi:hypothetical protein BHU43_04225 [Neisseria meningitidis]|uniref:Uncharacterized protein n=1 Tax=Neisseria meningitidis serogroup B (strain ATCC 13091 / M2091) TaxID=862513 RepID=E0N833_NEIM3|nr:hypothetical protein [Neisseria meningitidis]EFM04863.1 hypothetical protein HMPREF0602_0663 [Neisseria meningitidis ATCC 13091]KER39363.1 hypothetical protein F528_1678 [Neisseria meningitidis 992008]MBQ5159371.1 hypothetical protein [Neisseria meningitidis]MBQ5161681.1 hypothetical protein [Neisseria meningitidis]MBQ5200613.1 hypothetical protein [Neisseria meningitidis]